MIPSIFNTLDALPLTSNGKVDRKALPELVPAAAQSRIEAKSEAPAIIPRLAELAGKLLGVDEIEPEANLLDFGASSVDMVRIANVLEKELGFRPNIDEFYREPTLLGLALAYERHRRNEESAGPITEPRQSRTIDSVWDSFVLLKDPQEREDFKKSQPGLRRINNGQAGFQLISTASDDRVLKRKFAERRTHRQFLKTVVLFARFSKLLGCLRQISLDGQPKYLYPSAGGIYPVQTYLHIKARAVEDLAGGTYYYDPVAHRLILLNANVELPASIHDAFVNRAIFEQAAFSIFLISQMSAVAPIYGKYSPSFATLEAGSILQLLMMSAPECHIGLCPIGIVNFGEVQDLFALDESHVLIHSLLGGLINGRQDTGWTSFQEAYQDSPAGLPEREEIEL